MALAERIAMKQVHAGKLSKTHLRLETLEKTSRLLEESQTIAHIGGWEYDLATNNIVWTPEVYRIYGVGLEYNPNNLQDDIAFYAPASASLIEAAFNRAVQEGVAYDLELQLIRADGNTIWVRTMGRVIVEGGKITRVVGTIMDVTERKTAQLDLARLNENLEFRVRERTAKLEAANKELEGFAFRIAHDLKAPLRAISGFSKMVAEDYSPVLDDECKRRLAVVSENAAKLDMRISSIVTITRIGTTEPVPSMMAMREMALAMYHEVVPAVEIPCIKFLLCPIPDCAGDSTMMRRVWGNLISNSVKFTAGRVKRVIEITAETSDSEFKYCVRDNGVGFDPEYAGKLFNLFSRLHRDCDYQGTGAGLAIVRRIVELHGGQVGAEYSEVKGTVFWFTMPRKKV